MVVHDCWAIIVLCVFCNLGVVDFRKANQRDIDQHRTTDRSAGGAIVIEIPVALAARVHGFG